MKNDRKYLKFISTLVLVIACNLFLSMAIPANASAQQTQDSARQHTEGVSPELAQKVNSLSKQMIEARKDGDEERAAKLVQQLNDLIKSHPKLLSLIQSARNIGNKVAKLREQASSLSARGKHAEAVVKLNNALDLLQDVDGLTTLHTDILIQLGKEYLALSNQYFQSAVQYGNQDTKESINERIRRIISALKFELPTTSSHKNKVSHCETR